MNEIIASGILTTIAFDILIIVLAVSGVLFPALIEELIDWMERRKK